MKRMGKRYRIGLAAFYFTLFDEVMPSSFRQGREQFASQFAALLEREFEVIYPGFIIYN